MRFSGAEAGDEVGLQVGEQGGKILLRISKMDVRYRRYLGHAMRNKAIRRKAFRKKAASVRLER